MGTCPHTLNRDSLTQTGPIDCVPANLKKYGTCTVMRKSGWAFLELSWKSSASGSWESGNIGTIPVGYRPARNLRFQPAVQNAINHKWVKVDADGTLSYSNAGGAQDNSAFALYASWPLP